MIDDRITALADLPTENLNTTFKGCVVEGCPQRDTRAEKNGGLIEQDMDAALSIVTSKDHKRKVIFWWTPGKSMIVNSFIPCIHADSYFGTIEPGEEAYAKGLILFTEGNIKPGFRHLYVVANQAFPCLGFHCTGRWIFLLRDIPYDIVEETFVGPVRFTGIGM